MEIERGFGDDLGPQKSSIVVDSMKKISTNLDRIRCDSRNSRPKILGATEREEQWWRTEPVSGFSAVSAISAAPSA